MASVTNLGKISYADRGTYSDTATYTRLDVIHSNDIIYSCITDAPMGTPLTNATYFNIMFDGTTMLGDVASALAAIIG